MTDAGQINGSSLQPAGSGCSMLCIASAAGLLAAIVFLAFPQIDLAASRPFYQGDGAFMFGAPSLGSVIRLLLRIVFALACLASIAGFVMLAFFNRKLLGLGLAAWAYIGLCAAVGSGITANLIFKDNWGRARPVHVTEFGGTKQFTPALLRTDQCERNCSFVSGEASNMFVLGFAAALLADPARSKLLFLAAIALGSFAGLIRIGAGGHFLSDIVFAGVFMAFVARGLAWLVLERLGPQMADGGPFHHRMLRASRRWAVSQKRWSARFRRSRTPLR
ncbi:MAG: phosphatase PAP2 family protein [Rhodomicrobium sp.]|nr:phosphatase PAP2 family protein [Rhodomicrobium sp.]